MSAQTYTHPLALARLRNGRCAECGQTANDHSGEQRFWLRTGVCSLLPRGVTERVEWQRKLDSDAAQRPSREGGNCGAQVITGGKVATCTDHGLGHHDTERNLSWPDGEGALVGQYMPCETIAPGTAQVKCTLARHGDDVDHHDDDSGTTWPTRTAHLMADDLLAACGASGDERGLLVVPYSTPERITCLACIRLVPSPIAVDDEVTLVRPIRWASETIPAETAFVVAHVESYPDSLGGDVVVLNYPGTTRSTTYGPHVRRNDVRKAVPAHDHH